MVEIFIIFLVIILLLAAVIGIAVALRSRKEIGDFDSQYLDEEGNHIYYDRSLREKQDFVQKHPGEKPRTLRRLFSKR
ncbi:MAG: hypothetical protein K2J63_05805 [Muribaculaceae bacterium]|nr:hypothetical protein [Muribaculaceae bacterium]MDE6794803.1 hypothetical protein [Muribaculaceae bacterium]